MVRLSTYSVLGDFAGALTALERLIACRPAATVLVKLPMWLPREGADGRATEYQTVLGPAFGISAIPDFTANPILPSPTARSPDIVEQCFPNLSNVRTTDLRSAVAGIHAALGQLQAQLHRIMMSLLRNADTREAALDWLAAALRTNAERMKMRPDFKKASTDGFMLNVAAVALKMCEPFLDPLAGKAWGRLDARYASDPGARGHCALEDTRLAATSEAVTAWITGAVDGDHKYHFICECFFLTASALRLGFAKALDNCQSIARSARHYDEDAQAMEAAPGPGARQAAALRKAAERFKGIAVCAETALKQESMLNDVLAFYRLMAAYMLRLASPTAASGGLPTLPLPEPAPMEFSSLPVR